MSTQRHTGLAPLPQQVMVITGASSGIGRATARLAAARGAKLFLGSRDGEALESLCEEIRSAGGTASWLATDVGEEGQVQALLDVARETYGMIDTWVNVAGVGIIANLRETRTEDHRRLFDTNYWGVVHGSLAAAQYFRQSRRAGAIINVGSAFSDLAVPTMGAYAASKFAVKAFTSSLRVELAQEGLPVSVTLVKPSVIDTMFYDHAETTMETVPRIPPPRYAPSVVGEAILDAAVHRRREVVVGAAAAFAATAGAIVPGLIEKSLWLMRKAVWRDDRAPKRLASGLRGAPHEGRERSGRVTARGFSVTALAQRHPLAVLGFLAGTVAIGAHLSRPRSRFRF